jgi:hypothetical protein
VGQSQPGQGARQGPSTFTHGRRARTAAHAHALRLALRERLDSASAALESKPGAHAADCCGMEATPPALHTTAAPSAVRYHIASTAGGRSQRAASSPACDRQLLKHSGGRDPGRVHHLHSTSRERPSACQANALHTWMGGCSLDSLHASISAQY